MTSRPVLPVWKRVTVWLSAPVLIAGLAIGTVYHVWPLGLLALGIACLPAWTSSTLGLLNPRTRFELRAGLDGLSAIALVGVIVSQHSMLPAWIDVIGIALATLSLVGATLLLVAVWLRRRKRPA